MQTNKQPRDNTQGLGTEPIGRLLLRLALPALQRAGFTFILPEEMAR